VLLSIFSGSRQFVGGVILMLMSLFIMKFAQAVSLRARALLLVKIVSITIIVSALTLAIVMSLKNNVILTLIKSRFIEKTTLQLQTGSNDRAARYNEQLRLSLKHPFFGLGPGGFFQKTKTYPDSGFLGIIVDYGIFSALILITGVSIVFRWALKRRTSIAGQNAKWDAQGYSVWMVGCIIIFYWFNIWNELLREYFFWMMMGLLITQKQRLESDTDSTLSQTLPT
jgi:hypothetical protein